MLPILSIFGTTGTCYSTFLGLIPWYQYIPLKTYPDCSLALNLTDSSSWVQLWLVAIALVDDLLRIAGFLAIAFVIWGGIKLVTSSGDPQNIKTARETIVNALIGLAIAIVSINLVGYIGGQLGNSTGTVDGLPAIAADSNFLSNIANITFGIIGGIALIMLVIGGFKYVTSGGNSQQTASAKNTIIYALIGVAVAVFAFSIVNFVVVKLA